MKRTNCLVWCTAAALSLSAFTLSALAVQDTASASTSGQSNQGLGQVERGKQLIGKEVRSSDNKNIGKIDDLVVDLTSGHILYAVVGASKGKVAVAPEAFTSVQGNTVRANVDQQKLNGAPQFTSNIDTAGQINRADFVASVYQYFGQAPWWQGSTPANTGTFNDVHKVSNLEGMNVNNVDNQKVGDVYDVAVNLPAGRILYVILSPSSSMHLGNNLYALPPDAFTPGSDGKSLVSNIDQAKLSSAPHFAKNDWSKLANPAWAASVYQYYGKQPWFQQGGGLQPTGREGQPVYPNSQNQGNQ